ncbi:MAG: HAMP domain-containing sensor histidine kinase [Clostridiaceae bacterium]|nr:HAMP domain-containing sensor histidine kinase [Clostridiaceae bacterium]
MDKWNFIMVIIAVITVALSITIILLYRRSMKRLMKSLIDMLDSAMSGTFELNTLDESLYSAVETKMSDFLSSSMVSSRNLMSEKENINRLISDISHQTKTPVSNILLYSQILLEQKLPKDSVICAKALVSQAEKLNFLMISLIKASRLEGGIIIVNPQKGSVEKLIDSVIIEITPKAQAKHINIKTEISQGNAYYDAKWTAEAIYNVIDNAVKYSPKESNIKIKAIPYSFFFRIDVIDEGIGIKDEEQEKIFSRFYRSASVSEREGVGLGLFLTRQILSDGGGYIKVSSVLGKGSVFSIFLPIEKR